MAINGKYSASSDLVDCVLFGQPLQLYSLIKEEPAKAAPLLFRQIYCSTSPHITSMQSAITFYFAAALYQGCLLVFRM